MFIINNEYPYPLNPYHVTKIKELVRDSNDIYSRLSVFRFDLRYPFTGSQLDEMISRDAPQVHNKTENNVMKRFFDSLRSQIEADTARRQKAAYQPKTELFYVWTRELSSTHNLHYHVAILVNKDRFHLLGDPHCSGTLGNMIQNAWSVAIVGPSESFINGLVHFPKKAGYWLCKSDYNYAYHYQQTIHRLNYLAKERTKIKGDGKRNFGYSTGQKRRC